MVKRMLIDATHTEETRVVVLNGSRLEEFDVETSTKRQLKGNIYLAKIVRVEPSLQAAFVDYGGGRHGFLAFNEIHPDYYQIPVADRQALLAEHRAEMRAGGAAASADFDDNDGDETPAVRHRGRQHGAETHENGGEASAGHAEGGAPAATSDGNPTPDEQSAEGSGNIDEVEHIDEIEQVGGAVPVVDLDEGAENGADAASHDPHSAAHASDTRESETPEPSHHHLPESDNAVSIESGPGSEPRSVAASIAPVEVVADSASIDAESGEEAEEAEETHESREAPPRRHRPLRHYKIQEVIKRRQIVLVQVVKEERGTKGAALTTYLSLAGRYCVLMPNTARGGGVSRKITSAVDRKRLKSIVNELEIPDGMAVIIRTAGSERTKPEIKRDYEYLLRLWDSVRELTLQSSAPALVYEEANLIKRSIRDLYARDIDEILVEGDEGYRLAKDFMRMLTPSHAKKVQLYKDAVPMLHRFQVETQLDAMHSPTVQLKSGGYIVINQTEALVAIDVNSGRATRERHIEETAYKTNLEAADEVARQLRLRDLAGLIVIDFIDMEESRNNHAVERRLKDAMRLDRARIQLGRISAFGLLELSRQRLRPSLMESSFQTCTHCGGTGFVRSVESSAMHVLRAIEDEGIRRHGGEIRVTVHTQVALYLLNQKRPTLSDIELRYGMRVLLSGDDSLIPPTHRIDRLKSETPPDLVARPIHMETGLIERPIEVETAGEIESDEEVENSSDETASERAPQEERPRHDGRHRDTGPTNGHDDGGEHRPESAHGGSEDGEGGVKRRRRRRRRGRRDGIAPPAPPETSAPIRDRDEIESASAEAQGSPPVAMGEGEPAARRRRRGKRGGRRRNRGRDGALNPQTQVGENQTSAWPERQSDEETVGAEQELIADTTEPSSAPEPVVNRADDAAAAQAPLAHHREPSHESAPVETAVHHHGHGHLGADENSRPKAVETERVADIPSAPTAPPPSAPTVRPAPEPVAPPSPPRRGWWNRVL
jgi:ribonuclease E